MYNRYIVFVWSYIFWMILLADLPFHIQTFQKNRHTGKGQKLQANSISKQDCFLTAKKKAKTFFVIIPFELF